MRVYVVEYTEREGDRFLAGIFTSLERAFAHTPELAWVPDIHSGVYRGYDDAYRTWDLYYMEIDRYYAPLSIP